MNEPNFNCAKCGEPPAVLVRFPDAQLLSGCLVHAPAQLGDLDFSQRWEEFRILWEEERRRFQMEMDISDAEAAIARIDAVIRDVMIRVSATMAHTDFTKRMSNSNQWVVACGNCDATAVVTERIEGTCEVTGSLITDRCTSPPVLPDHLLEPGGGS